MKDIEKKDKRKIVLSLLIAALFVLSATASLARNVSVDSTVEEEEAGDINTIQMGTIPKSAELYTGQTQTGVGLSARDTVPVRMDDDGCWPVQVEEITVGGITLPAVISTGTYELCINVSKPDYGEEVPWYLFVKDCIQEGTDPLSPWPMQPLDVEVRCDEDTVGIRFSMIGSKIGLAKIRLNGDLGNRWYTTDLGDLSGGTIVYWGANPIPGSTVVRTNAPPLYTVEITIPREDPASGAKYWADCCDEIEWRYYVYNWALPLNENRGGWNADFCDVDMYDAEIKKFIEVYKWIPAITHDDITETIFCEDFEDPCQVTDKWDAVDVGPDGDTWVLSTNRFVSAGHSYHNTQHATYMPSAEDYLIFHNGTSGLDVSGMDELKVSFQHWMKGDFVDPNIMDYGWVEYSFTGAFCGEEVFAGGLYYDNDWEEVIFTIDVDPLSAVDDNLYLRFGFIADAGFCYEGWYIDDMCVSGTTFGSVEKGYWEFVMDSHSWPQIIEGPYEWYCFPEKWTVTEEDHYMVCAWLEALDECHYSMDTYGFEGDLCEMATIGNILELELDCPATITPASPATDGDDVTASTQVCNIGTLDATDVQVQMTVNRGTFAVIDTESFEGETPGQLVQLAPTEPGTYDDEWVRANPDGRCFVHYTNYEASDGSMAIAGFDASTPQPWRYNDGPAGGGSNWVRGPLLWTGTDTSKGIKVSFDAKANFESGDSFRLGIMDFTTGWSWLGSVTSYFDWTTFEMDISGDFLAGAIAYGPPYFHPEDQYGLAFRISYDGDFDASNPACPWNDEWSGYIIDNFVITDLVAEPEVIFEQAQVIPFLNITDCEPVAFTWPDAGVGQYVMTTEILIADEDDSNNICMQSYNVINIMETPSEVTFKDLTGEGPSHWMVEGCCGGYFWCGDPVTTTYGNDWDDCLIVAPGGNPTFDCSGYTNVDLEFDAAYKINASDLLYIEASVDDGSAWWTIGSIGFTNPSWPGFDFYTIDVDAMLSGYGKVLTDKMQFRFRFVSNATEVNRGVYLDNIGITGASYIFGPDDCTTMDNFETEEHSFGSWFQASWNSQYFVYDTGILVGPSWFPDGYCEPSYGCYDPDIFTVGRPWNGAYPDNINCTMDWTLDLPQCFYGYLSGDVYYDTDSGDTGYIEISNDGGANFDTLAAYSGSANDDYQGGMAPLWWVIQNDYQYWSSGPWDITPYVGSEVILRWRMESDALNAHGYGGFGPMFMAFYGMEDTNAPVTICKLEGDIDPVYLYYTDRVKVTLTATDDVTGIKETWYELDGGAAQLYDGPFMVRDDGEHIVCYWSVDNVNNVETKKCTIPFKIDQTGPSVTITAPEPGLYLFGNKLLDIEQSIHLFGGVQVAATVTVTGAPLKVVEFYMNDVLFAQDVTAPFEAFCMETNSGSATFKVVAIDVLDQSSEASITVDTYIKIL